jgi:hypothetical protein
VRIGNLIRLSEARSPAYQSYTHLALHLDKTDVSQQKLCYKHSIISKDCPKEHTIFCLYEIFNIDIKKIDSTYCILNMHRIYGVQKSLTRELDCNKASGSKYKSAIKAIFYVKCDTDQSHVNSTMPPIAESQS